MARKHEKALRVIPGDFSNRGADDFGEHVSRRPDKWVYNCGKFEHICPGAMG